MAIWQLSFFILPEKSTKLKNLFIISEDYTFDDSPFWEKRRVKTSFFKDIGVFLPQSKSWSKHLIIYGNEDSNRFEILFNDKNYVESVGFRIDVTSDYDIILNKIIEFCKLNRLVILDHLLNIIPLNFELFKNNIESFRF